MRKIVKSCTGVAEYIKVWMGGVGGAERCGRGREVWEGQEGVGGAWRCGRGREMFMVCG